MVVYTYLQILCRCNMYVRVCVCVCESSWAGVEVDGHGVHSIWATLRVYSTRLDGCPAIPPTPVSVLALAWSWRFVDTGGT